ncbi:MAG: hypothetical protein AUH42_00035 [Gemmatimonadetes bacterium 13_1_40CM_70_11]|nr:MAG: hypothetical protein AUH42_00035 [Gemmatimonadetes bacterium 13_1_40CM_70_11]
MGEYAALRPVDGCVVFPANASTTGTVEYLLVPQATTGTPDLSASFKLAGSAAAAAAPAFVVGVQLVAPPRSPVQRFHDRLRELERTRAYGVPGAAAPALPTVPVAPLPTATIAVGDTGRFKVLNTLTGFSVDNVTAVARKVGQHIAIFTDTGAPKPGLSATDLDTLRSVFDSVLYPTDTSAFGRESDIDGNGVVIVLLTNTVNKMVQDCSSGYVAGFFFGGDIDPFFRSRFKSG